MKTVEGPITYSGETGRTLSSAPEFGDDGSWPPASTPWLALRWELFEAESEEASTHQALLLWHGRRAELSKDELDPLNPNFFDAITRASNSSTSSEAARAAAAGGAAAAATSAIGAPARYSPPFQRSRPTPPIESEELRRLVHYVRWRRNDPVTQFAPDTVQEKSYSITTGLSTERRQMLAKSLGVQLGATPTGINAALTKQFQQQFGLKLEITEQEQQTTNLTLANPSGGYRLFALWRVEHLIAVDALGVAMRAEPGRSSNVLRYSWLPRAREEFVTNSDPVITFKDIARVSPVK